MTPRSEGASLGASRELRVSAETEGGIDEGGEPAEAIAAEVISVREGIVGACALALGLLPTYSAPLPRCHLPVRDFPGQLDGPGRAEETTRPTLTHTSTPVISIRSLVLACFVALACLVTGRGAQGAGGSAETHLASLAADVRSKSGPMAILALRRIWSEWDRSDPSALEETLFDLAGDRIEAPPVRAYAGLLEAYARRRRGDLAGARERIARLGFVGRWMMIGPFDNEGRAGMDVRYEPEAQLDKPLDVARDYEGKEHRPVRYRLLPDVSPYGWVDFGAFVRPSENACVVATTFVRDGKAPHAARTVSVWAGASGALRVFWNGTTVLDDAKYRELDSDREAVAVRLEPGWNRLTAKVCSDDRPPMLALRLADEDGAPDDRLEIDPDPSHSTESGGATGAKGRAILGRVEGPAQAFERMAKGEDPSVLEAYARYLEMTGADDPTEHHARELARKAAERAPTVARLLLAGAAAESRNQRATWLDRAEALVARGQASEEEMISALLARADYARSGVNGREAVPYYDRVLALDPDNVAAVLAKVDLFEAAGLRETGLAVLQTALSRKPRSVGLLRATVAALRDLGREAEAGELAERYAALRFDDPAFVRAHVDLAVARRDVPGATHWIDRLLATSPDSADALQTAGQAWLRLGDSPRALAAFRQALDIAPDDTDAMQKLATAYGLAGKRDEQIALLRRVLELAPQAKEVREELAHAGPSLPRPDEIYVRPASEFLAASRAGAVGQARRTLVDLQVTTVFPSGLASRFRQIVLQPMTDAAAAQAREYDFAYETDSQTVQLRQAHVFRKDGRVDEAVENGAGAMADDPALAIYTSSRSYFVRFPRIEPGDVVELQYRVEDVAPRNAFADYFGEVVYMQGGEPIGRSEYVLLTPKSRTLYFNEPRIPGLRQSVHEQGDQRIYDFVAEHVAGLPSEARQPPWAEVLGHVNVSTYKDWNEMGRWYWGLVRDQLVPDDEVRRRAEALTKGLADAASKVRAIYDYVVQKTRYVALEFGIHGYKPYRCAQIFARGFGDCKDKATLIVTMLRALGIQATPVIVRTGNKGDIETFPASLAPFDHMIAYVPSLDTYLDGTAEYTGESELPAMDRGALALQVNEGNPKLVHLPDPPPSASVTSNVLDATLAADGSAQVEFETTVTGVDAAGWRVRFHAEATRKQRLQQMLGAMLPGSEISDVKSSDLEDVEQPVQVRVKARAPHLARSEGEVLNVPVGRREHLVRDLAPQTARSLDVRLFAQQTETGDWTIHPPPGARFGEVPGSVHGATPFGAYELAATMRGAALNVKTSVTISKTRISAAEYPAFRKFCEDADRALGPRATLVLSR